MIFEKIENVFGLIRIANVFDCTEGEKMITAVRYTEKDSNIWNEFNDNSKNPLFMFDRRYMDYHRDRIKDHSLLFYDADKLVTILPMSEHGRVLVSHGGLTYGGFVTNKGMKQHTMDDCVEALIEYAKVNQFTEILYKGIPHIYHEQPAEEDRYALFKNCAILEKVEASTVVNLSQPIKMSKGRKAQISRARREGVIVEERTSLEDFNQFIDLENIVLRERHATRAVHTGAELKLLHDRLPQNIHLFVALYDKKMIAGMVVYEYKQVVHIQYMAADDTARRIGALDLIVNIAIDKYKSCKLWLDFGISTENGGRFLNEGLISQKEGFGGRTNVYETWRIPIISGESNMKGQL